MVFEQIIGALDLILSPVTILPPYLSLFIVSVFLTILILVLGRVFTNRKLIKEVKDRMEQIRENLTQAQKEGKTDVANEHLKELMKVNNTYMKQTFKLLIISLVIISLFWPWMKFRYEGLTVAALPFSLPVIGTQLGWIGWYILVSFTIGWVLRKVLGDD